MRSLTENNNTENTLLKDNKESKDSIDSNENINIESSKHLRGKFSWTVLALIIALLAAVSATYAWYIYNTRRHTTNVQLAAGAGVNLQISNAYGGPYASTTVLDSFEGQLNPVSTNHIEGGFQKVLGFTNGTENQPTLVANLFGKGEYSDYYKTSLFLRSNGSMTDIYLADIGFEDSDENQPISSAIRVGFVVHQSGQNQPAQSEYIFAISNKKILRPNIIQRQVRKDMCWTVRKTTVQLCHLNLIQKMHIVIMIKIQAL